VVTPAEVPGFTAINDLTLQTRPKAQPAVKGLSASLTNLELSNRFELLDERRHEAAQYLGISREKLRQLNLAGKGPPRTEDGRYLYEGLDNFNMS
jgi:hypothetical protein